ncbi:MAG TPA: ECF-type sigma factor [Acetobacteraceae bacterium]|nr:ECF-type sigma factor [Acetobacteraceae bacterium]
MGRSESMSASHEVTLLLARWGEGDRAALAALTPLIYAELRRLAARALSRERPDHTLQATALVHEAYLRLQGGRPAACRDRRHFLTLAARLMRRILVDHARALQAVRRGGAPLKLSLDAAGELPAGAPGSPLDLLELDAALDELAAADARKARVIELRFFAGLSVEEAAEALDVSTPTVVLDTRLARAFLFARLAGGRRLAG